jgi:hypothetical protein
MDRDECLSGTGWPDDLDLTSRDDEERYDLLSRLDEHLSRSDRTHVPMRSDPFNLRRRQSRKHTFHTRRLRQRHRESFVGHGRSTYLCFNHVYILDIEIPPVVYWPRLVLSFCDANWIALLVAGLSAKPLRIMKS